jgi:hypothetical protein
MKAEELMIGNYVTFKGSTSKVVAIMPPYLDLKDEKGNAVYSAHEDDIEPIRITVEHIINYPIVKVTEENLYYRIIDGVFLRTRQNSGYSMCGIGGVIGLVDFIHELQNLFFFSRRRIITGLNL